MITMEQVADLRPGDVVELADEHWNGVTMRGPLLQGVGRQLKFTIDGRSVVIRTMNGSPPGFAGPRTLTVIHLGPRPVYVNHDRVKPAKGDVVRDADGDEPAVWMFIGDREYPWFGFDDEGGADSWKRDTLPTRLRLLVDGEIGGPA